MYRRYYQRYDRFGEAPQRPIGENPDIDVHKEGNEIKNEVSVTAEPEIIIPEKPSPKDEAHKSASEPVPLRTASHPQPIGQRAGLPRLFSRFGIDDLILLGLIFIILQEEVDDDLLLIVLIFLLFTGL
ncbi:MAG: hypothetical protein JG777_909 [Clostridia bacterium]|nr:hypothetical protein [Clostridia bacterium]